MSPAPILDFDPDRNAVIDPASLHEVDLPGRAEEFELTSCAPFQSEMPDIPVYCDEERGLVVVPMGVGAPLAAGMLDALVARGVDKFIVCGGAGVLEAIPCEALLIPTLAIRDEGTSYHYLPPEEEARPSSQAVSVIRDLLEETGHGYREVTTWTTDAIFRETRGMVDQRLAEGASCVEMESAALFAVAAFRNVTLGQILYGGDDLSGEEWDDRGWTSRTSIREQLLVLATRACLRLE
jgi:uridine phosphorylase